jgi:hypothetical protein
VSNPQALRITAGQNPLPRKVAQFYQKVYDFLPSKFVIYNTACFWRFSASYPLKKLVSNVVCVEISYVLLAHPTVIPASPLKVVPPLRSYVLANSCGGFPKLFNGLLVNGKQIRILRSGEFINQDRKVVPERTQSVMAVFSEGQNMGQDAEAETNDKTDNASEDVWKPCLHITIATTFGLIGFVVGHSLYEKLKRK